MCEAPTQILILSLLEHYIKNKSLVIEVFLTSETNAYYFCSFGRITNTYWWEEGACETILLSGNISRSMFDGLLIYY